MPVNCSKCRKAISSNKLQHQCSACKLYFHPNCDNALKTNLADVESNKAIFKCACCSDVPHTVTTVDDDSANSNWESLKNDIERMQLSLAKIGKQCDDFVRLENQIKLNSANITAIESENTILKSQLSAVSNQCCFLEQQINSTKLLIYGLPSDDNLNLLQLLKDMCIIIGFEFSDNNLRNIHRIKSRLKFKPVVVDWSSRLLHQRFLTSAKLKKSTLSNVTLCGSICSPIVTDYLSPARKSLLHEAKVLLQSTENHFKYVWANHGIIYAKEKDDSNIIKILSSQDLVKFKH